MSRVDQPQPGYFRRRLAKGAPWVGCIIYYPCPFHVEPDGNVTVERSRPLLCMVNGEHVDPFEVWTWVAGQRISEAEYLFLIADAAHAMEFRPTAPRANPRKPIDLMDVELPW